MSYYCGQFIVLSCTTAARDLAFKRQWLIFKREAVRGRKFVLFSGTKTFPN